MDVMFILPEEMHYRHVWSCVHTYTVYTPSSGPSIDITVCDEKFITWVCVIQSLPFCGNLKLWDLL